MRPLSPEALAKASRVLDGITVLWDGERERVRARLAAALDETRLEAEVAARQEQVLKWADAERLIAWIDTPEVERKPANLSFSEGNERQIAYRFENVLSDIYEIIGELAWGAGPHPFIMNENGKRLSQESAQSVFEALRDRLRGTRGRWLKTERHRVAELERRVAELEEALAAREPR